MVHAQSRVVEALFDRVVEESKREDHEPVGFGLHGTAASLLDLGSSSTATLLATPLHALSLPPKFNRVHYVRALCCVRRCSCDTGTCAMSGLQLVLALPARQPVVRPARLTIHATLRGLQDIQEPSCRGACALVNPCSVKVLIIAWRGHVTESDRGHEGEDTRPGPGEVVREHVPQCACSFYDVLWSSTLNAHA